MRLIDGEALLNAYDIEAIKQHQDNRYVRGCLDIIGDIEDAPTIDAVPVIRCENCKHWNIREGNDPTRNYFCNRDGMWCKPIRKPTDFCSYGERKE